jgi:spore photoproduct lyase
VLDLSAELITHRFTPAGKEVLLDRYPRTRLETDKETRVRGHGRLGAVKYVCSAEMMSDLRSWFEARIAERQPTWCILYWT